MELISKEAALREINKLRSELFADTGNMKEADAFNELSKAYRAVQDIPEHKPE